MREQSERQSADSQKPVFRNPELYQVLPWRECFRNNFPTAKQGYVVEDLDLLILKFGEAIGRDKDDDGKFILCEIKTNGASMGYAQQRVWGLVHRTLRLGDPDRKYYHGFYLIGWNEEQKEKISINGVVVGIDGLREFVTGNTTIKSMFD